MSQRKHTPGPWFGNGDRRIRTVNKKKQAVCLISECYEREKNSRLITAAPELLEALELFFAEHDNTYDGEPLTIEMAIFLDKGRAAINKARGEA